MEEVELPNTEELSEARSKRFTKRIALTTAIYAVVLAITSVGGNNTMKEMLLAQQTTSDQWSYYQAKALRQTFYRIQRLYLEAELLDRASTMKPQARARFQDTIKEM